MNFTPLQILIKQTEKITFPWIMGLKTRAGSPLTLYEKVHPKSELNAEYAHQERLNNLDRCLPAYYQPIIFRCAF